MRVLKVENGIEKVVKYPRRDMAPIQGLSKGIVFYKIIDSHPELSENQYLTQNGYELTDNNDSEFPHLKIANVIYQIHEREPEEQIESIDETVKKLEELIVILSKDKNQRTPEDVGKLEEIKNKVETKNEKGNGKVHVVPD